jgi:hypothetical protein
VTPVGAPDIYTVLQVLAGLARDAQAGRMPVCERSLSLIFSPRMGSRRHDVIARSSLRNRRCEDEPAPSPSRAGNAFGAKLALKSEDGHAGESAGALDG